MRVPLSTRERALRSGPYPYHGAAGILDHIDDYKFDGLFVLVGEDGSVIDERGAPVLQLVRGRFWVSNHAHVLRMNDDADTVWLYYALRASQIRPFLSGSVQPKLSLGNLKRLKVSVPAAIERRAIAEMLGALDEKIESNRRTQRVIEELVRAIVTKALVQSGGHPGTLADYCSLVKSPVRVEEFDPDAKYISFEHMPKGSITLDTWSTQDGLASAKSRFLRGDVLFGKLRPYFKKVGIAPVGGVCSNDILVLRPQSPQHLAIVTVIASSDELIVKVSASATGTRMPRASWKDLADWPVPTLSAAELEKVSAQCSPLLERLIAAVHENRKLEALRDTLLPELLSGRISVSEMAA